MGEGHRDHLSKILMKTFAEAEIFFLTFPASPFFHPVPPSSSPAPFPRHKLNMVPFHETGDVLLLCTNGLIAIGFLFNGSKTEKPSTPNLRIAYIV